MISIISVIFSILAEILKVIDLLGLFGSIQMKLDFTTILGLGIMIFGIIIFKIK